MTKYEICELCGKQVSGATLFPIYRGMHLRDEHTITNLPTLQRIVDKKMFFIEVEQ